jgi:spermidine synthase
VAGLCSIIYELLISTASSYFLGDSIKQFTLLIGIYLFSMGLGAYFSKYFKNNPIEFFIKIEFLLGFIGGVSVPLIYFLFVNVSSLALQFYCFGIMFFIGLLTGLEVPLLTFSNEKENYEDNLSTVLSLDYIGGLIATLLFPFLLLPFIGLFYSSLLFGITNILLGFWVHYHLVKKINATVYLGLISLSVLVVLVIYTGKLLQIWENKIYNNPIIENIQSQFQKIVLTKNEEELRLYLNRQLQFSSKDEHRYHEVLTHLPMAMHGNVKKVLILGGGENLASRELLKYPSIESIEVVDIDPLIFEMAKTNQFLVDLNQHAHNDPRLKLINEDAFSFLRNNQLQNYDLIVADLPDPSNDALARLYSKQFYILVSNNLKTDGIFVTQSCDIYHSNKTFNCIKNTLNSVFLEVKPYAIYVPSFGNWGFNMAANKKFEVPEKPNLPKNLKYLDEFQFQNALKIPKDIKIQPTKINSLDNPVILSYFIEEWEKWKNNLVTEN